MKFAASAACAPSNSSATPKRANRPTRKPSRSPEFCYKHGLITITAGTFNNVIRILVPLVISDAQFDEGLDVIEAAIAAVAEKKQPALSHA